VDFTGKTIEILEVIIGPKNPQYFNDFQYFSIIFNIGVLWFLSYLFPLVPRSRSALFVHGTSPAGRVEWEESDDERGRTEEHIRNRKEI